MDRISLIQNILTWVKNYDMVLPVENWQIPSGELTPDTPNAEYVLSRFGQEELDYLYELAEAMVEQKSEDEMHLCPKCGAYLCWGECRVDDQAKVIAAEDL